MRWRRVLVSGQSMTPTLLDGDVVLADTGRAVRPGDVVIARFRGEPDLIVIKRTVQAVDGGWLLASDNSRAGTSSAQYGTADAMGVVRWVFRFGPGRPRPRWTLLRRWLPVRPGEEPCG